MNRKYVNYRSSGGVSVNEYIKICRHHIEKNDKTSATKTLVNLNKTIEDLHDKYIDIADDLKCQIQTMDNYSNYSN
jgi:hypothetical protein